MQPQASMSVEDSKPNIVPYSSQNNMQHVGYNQELVKTIGMDQASDTLWTHMGKTLITYMHIWPVEFEGYFAESQLFPNTLKNFFSTIREKHGMKATCLNYPCSPIKILT